MRYLAVLILFAFTSCRESAETAVPRLQSELESRESSVRSKAALAIGHYGAEAESAVPRLIELLRDPNSGVKSSAAFALRKIGTEEATAALDRAEKARAKERGR